MKIYKKALSITLVAAMLLGTVGCGKKNDSQDASSMGGSAAAKQTSKDYVYQEDMDFSLDGMVGDISSFLVDGDKMYMLTSEWLEGASEGDATEGDATDGDADSISSEGLVFRIYESSVDGGSANMLYEKRIIEDAYIDSLMMKPDGTLMYEQTTYADNGGSSKTELFAYNGKDFEKMLDITDLDDVDNNSYLSSVLFDKDGNMVGVYDNAVKTFDDNKNQISELKVDGYIDAVGCDKNGDILIETIEEGDESEEEEHSIKVSRIDTQKGEIVESYPLDATYLPSSDSLIKGTGEYDFYYELSTGIFGYKYADKKATQLIDFSSSDIATNNMGFKCMIDDAFYFTEWDWESVNEISTVHKYVKVDPSEVEDRVILTIASLYGNYALENQVSDFNKSQNKVRIKIVDYTQENDPVAKMSADIAAGNLPDMYDLSNGIGDMSMEQCIAKGLFEDLNPYIDKDEEISADDLIPSVYNTMLHDGKLYYVASSFYVSTLMARKSEVGEEPGWTFDEMKEYVDTKPDANLFYTNNKSDTLDIIMHACVDDFVDWDKGECYFDSPEFISVLEMCNRGTNDEMEWTEDTPSTEEMIRDGSMLFVDGTITPQDLKMYGSIFDGDISYKGYPNKNAKGTYFNFDECVAMSSKCEDKDAAWDFIRQYITEDYQSKEYINQYAIPTREDVYEAYVQSCTCTEETKDKYGNDLYPISGYTGWDEADVELKPLTSAEMDDFRSLIDGAEGVWQFNDSLSGIIEEEAMAYFKGDKSAEDAAKIIQNRATTYVNENK